MPQAESFMYAIVRYLKKELELNQCTLTNIETSTGVTTAVEMCKSEELDLEWAKDDAEFWAMQVDSIFNGFAENCISKQ
jgi:hypothetical protein